MSGAGRSQPQKSKGQVLFAMRASKEFREAVYAGLVSIQCGNASQFFRDAIWEKLGRDGVRLERSLTQAPIRTGRRGSAGA